MQTITPHRVWYPAFREQVSGFSANRTEKATVIEEYPGTVNGGSSSLYLDARVALAVDPEAAELETWYAWTAAMQMYHAMFAVSSAPPGETVECLIDHKKRRLTGMGPQHFSGPDNWLTAFYLAITCRDQKRWTELAHFPLDVIRASGESTGSHFNPYTYHWVAALQAMIQNRPDRLFSELERAIELSDPRTGAFGGEILDKLSFPPMNAFRCLVQGDSQGFNEALAQGLRLFKDYYTSTEERAGDIDGIVPLDLLALACLAYDRHTNHGDFPLEVESGYLPKFILNAAWYGEFPI